MHNKSCYNCVYGTLYLNNHGNPYAYCDCDIGDNIAEPEKEASKCSFYIEDSIDEFEEWKKTLKEWKEKAKNAEYLREAHK